MAELLEIIFGLAFFVMGVLLIIYNSRLADYRFKGHKGIWCHFGINLKKNKWAMRIYRLFYVLGGTVLAIGGMLMILGKTI